MWRMLQQDSPDDFVLATGEMHSVKDFIEIIFQKLNLPLEWKGEGLDEKGFNPETGDIYIEIDPYYFRPTEVELLLGDPSKATKELNWKRNFSFSDLVEDMVNYELNLNHN